MTPSTAFAPQTDPPGPRMTSILSMSSRGKFTTSQKTPPKVGVYTALPSNKTNSLLLNLPSNPRIEMAQVVAVICATFTPGTIRSKSGMFSAPELRISSAPMTNTAEAVCESFSSVRETEVTWTFIRSSMLIETRSADLEESCALSWANPGIERAAIVNIQRSHFTIGPPFQVRKVHWKRETQVPCIPLNTSVQDDPCKSDSIRRRGRFNYSCTFNHQTDKRKLIKQGWQSLIPDWDFEFQTSNMAGSHDSIARTLRANEGLSGSSDTIRIVPVDFIFEIRKIDADSILSLCASMDARLRNPESGGTRFSNAVGLE